LFEKVMYSIGHYVGQSIVTLSSPSVIVLMLILYVYSFVGA